MMVAPNASCLIGVNKMQQLPQFLCIGNESHSPKLPEFCIDVTLVAATNRDCRITQCVEMAIRSRCNQHSEKDATS